MPTICDIVYNYSCIVVSGHVDRFWVDLWVWMSKSLWYLLLPPKSWICCSKRDFKKKREKTTESTQSESENFWSCQFHSHCFAILEICFERFVLRDLFQEIFSRDIFYERFFLRDFFREISLKRFGFERFILTDFFKRLRTYKKFVSRDLVGDIWLEIFGWRYLVGGIWLEIFGKGYLVAEIWF